MCNAYISGMFSWFPIMFPILQPIQLKKGDNLTLNFWRLVSKEKCFETLRLVELFFIYVIDILHFTGLEKEKHPLQNGKILEEK